MARQNRRTAAVFLGQCVAVLVVLVVTNALISSIQALGVDTAYLKIISGGILTAVGFVLFRSYDKDEGEDEIPSLRKTWNLVAVSSAVIYWLNSLDDISVMSGMLIPLQFTERLVYSVGFLVGWMTSFMLAYQGSKINMPWLYKTFAGILILWGLVNLCVGLYEIA